MWTGWSDGIGDTMSQTDVRVARSFEDNERNAAELKTRIDRIRAKLKEAPDLRVLPAPDKESV